MNLCIDQGNTYLKAALFENDNLLKSITLDANNATVWAELFAENNISNTIISSVKAIDSDFTELLKNKSSLFVELNHQTLIPVNNCYKTPETLGKDRLAAVIGAVSLYPNHPILVVDAGTALTFDFITEKGDYLGGAISPGLDMRFKALHTFTDKLPLVKNTQSSLIGNTTELAIASGVVNGMLYEIEGTITQLKAKYPTLLIFLTGGNCFFFESKLKKPIFANQNLVLIGLNSIINYNAKNNKK
ncbi:MAG: type III pantothenate kinase [Paludibacteraceae bacterium]|nr:type III pantothenate kinase [Paludibacteraceae bacterium]MBN2787660.1 type III pantothenate kinase [Paludibacteraceae bacterium]